MYVFNYSYFDSKCTDYNLTYNEEQCLRLKLNSIFKYSDAEKQNIIDYYIFDYYEDRSIPKIGTFHLDPFGYKSPLAETQTSYLISNDEWDPTDYAVKNFGKVYNNKRMPRRPNLYKYEENQGDFNLSYYSTLKIPELSPVKVNTDTNGYDQVLSTLEDSRAWSLKSIQYLTQGEQLFNYELNNFNWKGQSISGGGLRISSIDLIDANKTYTTTYEYSGGEIANLPMVTNGKYFFYTTGYNSITSISQNIYGKETTYKGSSVLYENVTQNLSNNGKIVYKYSTINANPLKVAARNNINGVKFDLYNYHFPLGGDTFLYMRKQPLIGNLLERYEYNDSNELLKKEEYKYSLQNKDFPVINNVHIEYTPSATQSNNTPYFVAFNRNSSININIPSALYSTSWGFGNFTPGKESSLYRNNLSEVKMTEYFGDKSTSKNKVFTYLDTQNLLKNITEYTNNSEYKNEILYPFEQGDQFNQQMSTDDNVNTMSVGNKKYNNGTFVMSNINKYSYASNTSNESINLVEQWQVFPQNNFNKTYFSRYDNKNNAVEVKNNYATPTTYIWGYGQNLLLVKIEGATYAQVMEALSLDPNNSNSYLDLDIVKKSNLHINDDTEHSLLESLDAFRKNLPPDNMVTTYTYDPLVGVTSITNPSGIKEHYKYNPTNRLEKILNSDNKIVKKFKYNYKEPTKYGNTLKSQIFARNNCNYIQNAGNYTYTIPQGVFTSYISQIDADRMAQEDIDSNGQNMANTHGSCDFKPFDCTVSTNLSVSDNSYNFFNKILNNDYVSYNVTIHFNTKNINWNSGESVKIGNINGICRPLFYKFILLTSTHPWSVSVDNKGDIYASLFSTSYINHNKGVILGFQISFDY